jgi:hypothetical protein
MREVLSQHGDEAYAESLARKLAEKKCKQLEGDLGAVRIQEAKLNQENARLASGQRNKGIDGALRPWSEGPFGR